MVKTSDFDSENSGSSPDEAASPPPPLCVFCNAPWTDDMLKVFAEAEIEDGYYDSYTLRDVDVSIDVKCSTCGRLVYQKHVTVPGERKY